MYEDLKNKVVVVTGGVTGIGGAASLGFAAAGATVLAQYYGGGPELATIEASLSAEIDEASEFALAAPFPDPSEAFEDVYAEPVR